jgi:hypothetical protein
MGVHVDLDHLDPVAVGPQHGREAVHDDLVVVDDRESDGHGDFRREGVPLVLTYKVYRRLGRKGPTCCLLD